MADQPTTTSKEDQIVKQCRAEYEAGLKFRHNREKAWAVIEDFYFNRVKKSIKSRFNAPVPIMSGFVESWLAGMAKHAELNYTSEDQADYRATKKATSLYVTIKSKDDYDWDMADSDGKKLAGMSGRAIYSYFAQSKPKYKSTLESVDHYDFIADPLGGGDLENHNFVQRDNLFRSKAELKAGVDAGRYDAGQVTKLVNATKVDVIVDNDNQYRSKQNRFMALGIDGFSNNYAGQQLVKFIEAGTTYEGKRYYILFNYETGIWVRCQPLEEVFKSGLWWFTSWATNRDPFNFWSKGPSDDMVPICEIMRVLINQELDNRNKRNYGQRMYDPAIFPDPAQLEWRADGLVAVKAGTASVLGDLKKGIATFETAELTGTINLTQYLDGLWKEKSGVNSENQGESDTSKVGIAYLNVQQSNNRKLLVYESYVKCWQAIGRRFLWGLFEHLRSPQAIKIIGEAGEEWDELVRQEVDPEWNIRIEGGPEDMTKDELRKKALTEIFATLMPDEMAVTSPKWRMKTKLQIAGVDEDDIRMAFDLQGDQNKEVLSKASQMIQDCLDGKPYKPYRGATTAFVQKIVDYATDTDDLPMAEYMKLMQLAQAHMPIAQENAVRKAMTMRASTGAPSLPPPSAPASPFDNGQMPGQTPAAASPAGTQNQSQGYSQLSPNPPQP